MSFLTEYGKEEQEPKTPAKKTQRTQNRLIPNKILADFSENSCEIYVCYSKGTIQRICLKDVLAAVHPS